MGFATEDEIPQGDYYCEQCKPEDHVEVIKFVYYFNTYESRLTYPSPQETEQAPSPELRKVCPRCTSFADIPIPFSNPFPEGIEAAEHYE